jgi:hypothetical protein
VGRKAARKVEYFILLRCSKVGSRIPDLTSELCFLCCSLVQLIYSGSKPRNRGYWGDSTFDDRLYPVPSPLVSRQSLELPCKAYRTISLIKRVKSWHLTLGPLPRESSPSPLWASLGCFPERLVAFRNWKEAVVRRPPEVGV